MKRLTSLLFGWWIGRGGMAGWRGAGGGGHEGKKEGCHPNGSNIIHRTRTSLVQQRWVITRRAKRREEKKAKKERRSLHCLLRVRPTPSSCVQTSLTSGSSVCHGRRHAGWSSRPFSLPMLLSPFTRASFQFVWWPIPTLDRISPMQCPQWKRPSLQQSWMRQGRVWPRCCLP